MEWGKKDFNTIYDKMFQSGNLDLHKFKLKLTPINDTDVSIIYPTYEFNL